MRIAISANGEGLAAVASRVFGRCPYFVFVDTEGMLTTSVENPAVTSAQGAGIQAAQLIIQHGTQVVLTGNVGPHAMDVLKAAQVDVHPIQGATVREAVEMYVSGGTQAIADPTVTAHGGLRQGAGHGSGGAGGHGFGHGSGRGR